MKFQPVAQPCAQVELGGTLTTRHSNTIQQDRRLGAIAGRVMHQPVPWPLVLVGSKGAQTNSRSAALRPER